MAVKKHVKVDIKLFLFSPILLDFSILFQIFCPGLPWNPEEASLEKFLSKVNMQDPKSHF